jgi:hypothetical protein
MNETQIVLAGFLIILLSSVAFNVSNFTGFTVKNGGASIAVSPINVYLSSGNRDVKINVMPNSKEGVSKYLYVKKNNRVVGKIPICSETTHRCLKGVQLTYTFSMTSGLGAYAFEFFDYYDSDYKSRIVNVRG